MVGVAWAQLRRRWGRALVSGLALLIASAGFVLLTSQAEATRLETVGTVQAHALSAYDILVRPPTARTSTEVGQGLVAPGFLSSIHGGITLAQWHAIQQVPGVSVAAPVALLGYALPVVRVPVDVSSLAPTQGQVVVRNDVTWSTDSGLTTVKAYPRFVYLTSNPFAPAVQQRGDLTHFFVEQDGSTAYPVGGVGDQPIGNFATSTSQFLDVFSPKTDRSTIDAAWPAGLVGFQVEFRLPYVVAAVDPASEDALDGLSGAVVSGAGLQGASLDYPPSMTGQGVPVLASTRVPVGLSMQATVSVVDPAAVATVRTGVPADQLTPFSATPTPVTVSLTAQQAYEQLLHQFKDPPQLCTRCHRDNGLPGNVLQLQQVGPLRVDETRNLVQSRPVDLDQAWPSGVTSLTAPAGSEDVQVRPMVASLLNPHQEGGDPRAVPLVLRGVYDESRLTGLSDLTAQLLGGYTTLPTVGGDDRSTTLLHGQGLAPSGNLGGLVQAPPSMITTLDALPQLTGGKWEPTNGTAPLSAVRVKVAGVTGIDDVSRERVRLAADRISQTTGLALDVTVGASTTQRTLTLPAGNYGRPELVLSQPWLKKGVGVAIVTAVDRKSLALFVMVLLVSALTVANGVTASVRARRRELAMLAGLGWRRRDLFRLIFLETGIVAAAAGLVAAGASLAVAAISGLDIQPWRAALAVPICLAVALTAAILPARTAARATPITAVQPAVTFSRRTRLQVVWSTGALARANLSRSRSRTVLAAAGVGLAVAVCTALVGVAQALQGAVVGTALGDAVAIQTRTADYAAGAATSLLALVGVAAVLYLNIRDRGPELATLLAVGWRCRDLAHLITREGTLIGVYGAIPGALLGVTALTAVTGQLPPLLAAAGAAATVVTTVACALAAYLTTILVRRLPVTTLLAG